MIQERLPAAPLRALLIDARLANFNATAEADGVWVEICPLDSYGQMKAVWGTLEIAVIAHRRGPSDYPAAFPRVARGVFQVHPGQFGPYGAEFFVPYQRPHPEFNTDLAPRGLVHARVNVPGEGSFEATTEVRLRPYSVIRDQMQLLGYSRFWQMNVRPGPKSGHFDDNSRHVIDLNVSLREVLDGLVQSLNVLECGSQGILVQHVEGTIDPESRPVGIHRFRDAVREQEDEVV